MQGFTRTVLGLTLSALVTSHTPAAIPTGNLTITLEEVASGLTSPLTLTHAGDGSGRLFVVDQIGQIRVIENGQLLPTPFLDIGSKLPTLGTFFDERGLLGLAFHPDYENNGRFFVRYSSPRAGDPNEPCNQPGFVVGCHTAVLAEYSVSGDRNVADPNSEIILFQIDEPQFNHNAGHVVFGPDGFLYFSLGDGGGANDGLADDPISHGPGGNGQNIETALGSVLRIDVDGGSPFAIPPDNPFVGIAGNDEIYAYGFRNPYRFSFDRGGTNELFLGDVGQNIFEELDVVVNGGNYGWVIREGAHCFDPLNPGEVPPDTCPTAGLIDPIAEYDHSDGLSIIGGYVYRGTSFPALLGKYIFGDFSQNFGPTGRLFYIDMDGDRSQIFEFKLGANNDPLGLFVFGFGEGEGGELYALTSSNLGPVGNGGQVHRIVGDKGEIRITQTEQTIQGGEEILEIVHDSGIRELGGFDFLIQYDASALAFLGADEGNIYEDYDWEFFTFRFGPNGNCTGGCPTGKARIIGIANINDGAVTPSSLSLQAGDVFARLRFLVSNDRTLECQFVPVRFCWIDCGDNTLTDPTGDSLYVSCFVFDYNGTGSGGTDGARDEITDGGATLPSIGGAPGECIVDPGNGKSGPLRVVNFLNGGVRIVCADEIDDVGDLNLNGIPYEIADVVIFVEFFKIGLTAFAPHIDASVAASDVNRDGMPLTVADLVYLIRIIIGDALPFTKLAHNSQTAAITTESGIISSDTELGAALFEIGGDVVVKLLAENMSLEVSLVDGVTRALVYSLSGETIAPGEILSTSGELISVEAGDPTGAMLNAVTAVKPSSFALHQNYPNPFNPSTKIKLDLSAASEWKISIYNLNGRLVKEFSGFSEAGTVSVDWDASSVASGIYFYKAQVGSLSNTRKMALVK